MQNEDKIIRLRKEGGGGGLIRKKQNLFNSYGKWMRAKYSQRKRIYKEVANQKLKNI